MLPKFCSPLNSRKMNAASLPRPVILVANTRSCMRRGVSMKSGSPRIRNQNLKSNSEADLLPFTSEQMVVRILSSSAVEYQTDKLIEVTRRIRSLGNRGQLKAAIAELSNCVRQGIQPDLQAATALLSACAGNKKMELAESVFEDLFGEDIDPDEVSFCVMLRGYGALTPPNWPKIKQWLKNMENDHGIQSTTATYNTLLEICQRTNDTEMAETFVDQMAARRIHPDDATLAIVRKKRSMRGLIRRLEHYIAQEHEDGEDNEA